MTTPKVISYRLSKLLFISHHFHIEKMAALKCKVLQSSLTKAVNSIDSGFIKALNRQL